MPRPYIGVTGVVTPADVAALAKCVDLLPQGYRLMAGVLVSAKTLRGERTTNARYPTFGRVSGLLEGLAAAGCWPVVHFNCRENLHEHLGPLARLTAMRGLQLNVSSPDVGVITMFKRERADVEFILQVNNAARGESGVLTKASALAYIDRYDSVADFALVDASGGRGEPINIKLARSLASSRGGMAFAGGFGPDSYEAVREVCASALWPSFDAETRVRRPLANGIPGESYQDELDPVAAAQWVRTAAREVSSFPA